MGNLGVFEVMANAGKTSAEAEASKGYEFEKDVDRAIFRAKERFGAYLANSQSKQGFDERWSEVKPQVIKVIAEVLTPTPGVIRRVGAALRPPVPAQAPVKQNRPSSAKTIPAARSENMMTKAAAGFQAQALVAKTAWAYDKSTKLWTSKDSMQKFACPGCGTEQDHLGFTHCAGCERTWNSWPVRQASSEKTSSSTYVLMAREIKMRGDQFKMAGLDVATKHIETPVKEASVISLADGPMPQEPPPGMSQPGFGTMPGDNSAAMGAPMPPEQPPTPMAAAAGDADQDRDVAGGVTEDSPIDQIQDALQDAIVALKNVQMLSINPALATTAGTKVQKIATLRTSMDRFWALHKQMNYVAGMLAEEANQAIKTADPRITSEAEFVKGYQAAAKNDPLPPLEKTGRAYLEGYVAFHKQTDTYSDGANYGPLFEPGSNDESTGARNEGSYLSGDGLDDAAVDTSDAGPFSTSQPAQQDSARQIDQDNSAGRSRSDRGESSTIQPTGARRTSPKAKK